MPRGSKPGERRGGRQRLTPNKRTVLTDRILAAALANPKAAPHELLLMLTEDQTLPAETRTAVAAKVFPAAALRSKNNRAGKSLTNGSGRGSKKNAASLEALYFLLSVAQDTGASPEERHGAASRVAQHFLPKNPRGKTFRRRKFAPDECGFAVDPQLAAELRDSKLKLACLPLAKKLTPYAIAQKARKLEARIREITESLQCPCPSKYRLKDYIDRTEFHAEVVWDNDRLKILQKRRLDQKVLAPEEDLEEAIRGARFDSFVAGPEMAARERLSNLRQRRRAARYRAQPLTLAEETTFQFLSLLYPLPRRLNLQDMPEQEGEAILQDHPFLEPRYIVGNPNYTDGFLILGTSKRRAFT
jgi:hypothetical protein